MKEKSEAYSHGRATRSTMMQFFANKARFFFEVIFHDLIEFVKLSHIICYVSIRIYTTLEDEFIKSIILFLSMSLDVDLAKKIHFVFDFFLR